MKILSVVGTRPNFMKVAPIARALRAKRSGIAHLLVHTGQHYDAKMSGSFFADLELPDPDFNLGIGSGSHAEQTAAVMIRIEPILLEQRPDVVLVVGDVNSTLACALTAKKLDLTVAHVEAGLRSFDRTMPEEINRLCTDAISDLLFTTDHFADDNLRREGVADHQIHFVGNVMIDSLLAHLKSAEERNVHGQLGLEKGCYATLTLHRPANVDHADKLAEIIDAIREALPDLPIIFPIHPRTRARVADFGLSDRFVITAGKPGIFLTDPLSYTESLNLIRHARMVLTDSGGLQEETTFLGTPCVTLRENTERPVTISQGTNRLAGTRRPGILDAIAEALRMQPCTTRRPDKWDGHAAERIVEVLTTGALRP